MLTSAIKKQTSVCCSISLNPYTNGISNLELRKKESKKESNSIVSLLLMSAALPIATFICEHCPRIFVHFAQFFFRGS